MIPSNVAVYIALAPVDFRRGFDGLSEMARRLMQREVKEGGIFVFCNGRRDRLKVVWSDTQGINLYYRRVHRGTFQLPTVAEAGVMALELDTSRLANLLSQMKLPFEKTRASP